MGIIHRKTASEGYLPGLTAPTQKEVYCAPLGEGTNGSRDGESHQLAVCSSCLSDTEPTHVKHKMTSYNQVHAFFHVLPFDLINETTDRKYEMS